MNSSKKILLILGAVILTILSIFSTGTIFFITAFIFIAIYVFIYLTTYEEKEIKKTEFEEIRQHYSIKNEEQKEQESLLNLENFTNKLKYENKILKEEFIKHLRKKLLKENYEKTEYLKKIGAEYEKIVANYFTNKGYCVEERGLNLGLADEGIDVVAKDDNEILLIQCKNYSKDTKITHSIVKEFNSNCLTYLAKYGYDETKKYRFLFVFPNYESLEANAKYVFKDEFNKCEYKIISNR